MRKKRESETFGARLRHLREEKGLSLEELGSAVKMKPSHLAALEEGRVLPQVAEIITLARSLLVAPSAFLGGPAADSAGRRREALAVRTRDYAYQTLTEDDPEKHLMAFRVTIDPKSDHRQVGYQHEGEEFVYVLSGRLWIKVGRRSWSLKAGESLRFDSGEKHRLSNPGIQPTELLVVIYTP